MKHLIVVLLCLLLCGCGQETASIQSEALPEETAISVTAGLYDPDHPVQQQYPGLVRAYPLTLRKVQAILPFEKDILILSGQGSTRLTRYAGENLMEVACATLAITLKSEDPSLQIHENGISYFDPVHKATILLDPNLQQIGSIPAPEGLSGVPILSYTQDTLYYCTGWSVVAWDLKSGIRRTLKEMSYACQELTALHQKEQILECRIQDHGTNKKLFLSADLGLEQARLPESAVLHTVGDLYFSALISGYQTLMVFGNADMSPELLLPSHNWQQQFYLPEDHGVVTVTTTNDGTQLDYYELSTGILRSTLTLDTKQIPKSMINTKDHAVYILTYDTAADCDMVYRWDPLRQPPSADNTASFKTDYHTNPEALKSCQDYADAIGETYGITVRIAEDAVAIQPWDYQFQPETLAPVLGKELRLLEKRLAQYPEGILEQTKSHFTGLTICLVRSIIGTGESASLPSATGIQFFNENEAYVVITTGTYSEQALYHELYHVMETHILTESTALDPWEALNPGNFSYNQSLEEAEIYLQGQTRAFVDHYSMVYPKEDRARVFENAMLSGKHMVFQSEYMQRKLTAICTGIREAYKLKKHPDTLPWEQYLANPLSPNS